MKTVKIKPEFLNENEEQIEYKVIENNGDRLLISPIKWEHGDIVPTESVRDYMLEEAA